MTDPIAKGVKLEDAIVILREGLRSDRPLTLKERLLIGKIIDERAALTAAGEMARELAEAREALKPLIKLKEAIDECKDDTWECQCGRSEPWWTGSNAHYASEYPDVPK